jgi:purine-binding chemotaxis protein CheW
MSRVSEPEPPSTVSRAERAGKYLTFSLAGEEYGVAILKVREIVGIMEVTAVPRMPAHVRGVVNLRGRVIPVIDLRRKLDMGDAEYTDATCIIVVDVGTLMGIIVDTVRDVLGIADAQIDPAPPLGAAVDTAFILGMGKVRGAVKILLDIDKVLEADRLVQSVGG